MEKECQTLARADSLSARLFTEKHRCLSLNLAFSSALSVIAKCFPITQSDPLLNALLERITARPWQTDWSHGTAQHLIVLCRAELEAAHQLPLILRFPDDRRLAGLSADTLPPRLHDWPL